VRLVRLPDPSLRLLRGSILDLSQSKRALAELQQSERRFAAIFNESPVGMAITSIEESTVLDANFAVCRMLGVTREQALGSSMLDYTNWEPGERESLVKELVAGSEPAMIEKSLRRSDGRSIVAQMQFTVVELGGLKRLLVAISDVTERNRAEDILRENEERFRLLVEGSNELVVLLEPTGTVLYASPNHVTITGFTPEELAGSSFLEHVHPDDMTAVTSQLEKVSTAITYRSRFKDRSWHWIESSGRNFSLSSGERRGVVVSRDISARIAAEEARKALETQLRQSQKLEAIGTLAGGIAHDFNNILTGVMGHLELVLLELPKSHVLRPQLDNAFNSCKRARSLISQILTFSRQKEPTRQSAHIGPVIHEAIRLLRASLPATIEIDLDVDDDTPAIDCDVTQIHQLVMNLATNAAHAMAGGGRLTVSLYCVAPDADALRSNVDLCAEHTVRLSIRDTGVGMDAATLERIFDPFFTTKEPGEGTGLGLPVVHGIMKEHFGAIIVASTPGMGTRFDLYFRPAVAEPQPVAPVAAPQTSLAAAKGRRVLFVEDEATIRNVGSRILGRIGCEVLTCPGAAEALAHFKKDPGAVDLVLSDLTMPGMTGVELARACLAIRPDIPFVVMTGYLNSAEIDKARAVGITHFVRKPFEFSSLIEVLKAVWAPGE
jgi:PAS domain S-box-containing protein